jgi:hypothetical protein
MRIINPFTIFVIGAIIYFALLYWVFRAGVQYGQDYMVTHYQVLGI